MKIALVHSFYSAGSPSGENTVVRQQVSALQEAGYEIRLFSAQSGEPNQDLAWKLKTGFEVATGLGPSPLLKILDFNPNVLMTHNLFPNFGTSWIEQIRVPIIATVHNFRPICAAGTLFRNGQLCFKCPSSTTAWSIFHSCYHDSSLQTLPLAISNYGGLRRNALLTKAAAVVFPSARTAQVFEKYGIETTKSHVIPHFLSQGEASTGQSGTGSSSYWLFAGRLSPEKGIIELLTNWPKGERLIILGSGPLEAEVIEMARHDRDIEFLGQVSEEIVEAKIENAVGVLLPSLWFEGAAPLVYVKSVAFGRPVLSMAGNSISDDIKEARNGVVIENFSELSRALNEIRDSQSFFSANSRARYANNFTKELWLRRMKEVFTKVKL